MGTCKHEVLISGDKPSVWNCENCGKQSGKDFEDDSYFLSLDGKFYLVEEEKK